VSLFFVILTHDSVAASYRDR